MQKGETAKKQILWKQNVGIKKIAQAEIRKFFERNSSSKQSSKQQQEIKSDVSWF